MQNIAAIGRQSQGQHRHVWYAAFKLFYRLLKIQPQLLPWRHNIDILTI